jgi:hypothetical protein
MAVICVLVTGYASFANSRELVIILWLPFDYTAVQLNILYNPIIFLLAMLMYLLVIKIFF